MSIQTVFSTSNYSRQAAMQSIIDQYDFVGVTERFDESIVALQMLLNIPAGDLLYLDAKHSGGYDDGRYKSKCVYIVPKFLSPGMRLFFASEEWKEKIKYETAVYWAAHRSLDLTIDALGRERVEKQLRDFRLLHQRAMEACADDTVFPCLASGETSNVRDRDCLFSDSGCGASCLDGVAELAKSGSRLRR